MCDEIAALLTLAKSWKQPKYLSTNKWIDKMWYMPTIEYYSVFKRKEILTHQILEVPSYSHPGIKLLQFLHSKIFFTKPKK